MSKEDTPTSGPVNNKTTRQAADSRSKSTSHQPSTHKGIHKPTDAQIVRARTTHLIECILEALEDKQKQALELHHESTDAERALAAGCYSEAMNDAIGIVKHQAHRSASGIV